MASLEPPLQPGLARRIPDDGDEDEEAAPRGPVSRLLYRLAQRAQQGEARLQELLGRLRGGQGKAPPAALIPDHPRDLSYPDLEFLVPQAGEYRHEFDNGLVLYLIEDHELPTLDLELMVRTGERYNEDRAKWGLADLTADMLRRGGTVSFTEEEIDEKLDFIAGRLSSFAGYDQATISLSVMAKDADFGLDLLAETLLKPRFDEKKLARHKERTIERMKSRNDSPPAILSREFTRLIYGAGHSRAWNTRKSAIERLSRADLRDWHRREYQPDRAILVASGDFETNAFLSALKKRLGAWKATPRAAIPKLPRPQTAKPGVYLIEKDTNQGYVSFGHLSVKRDNPDYHALQVMNFILGGGSFTSRMMSKVRSDEGLAYSVYSRFGAEDEEPGVFFAGVQSKSSTVAFAIELMFAEIERMRGELVGEAELESAKSSFIERFPSTFGSRMGTVQALAELEFRNRPADYYNTYRDKIRAVTAEDVRRVAREYLKPEKMVIGVVGQPDELLKGDGVHKKLADFGPITRVPLLDPLGDDF